MKTRMRGVSKYNYVRLLHVQGFYSARFMPIQGPAVNGYLHLSFPSHPPPEAQHLFSLFRPSLFPLAVIGVASCTSDPFTTTLQHFDETLRDIASPESMFPLAKACFAFEDEGGDGSQLADQISGIEVIPSMDTNKTKMHIGTLLASLCSRILAEFSSLVCLRVLYLFAPLRNFAVGAKP